MRQNDITMKVPINLFVWPRNLFGILLCTYTDLVNYFFMCLTKSYAGNLRAQISDTVFILFFQFIAFKEFVFNKLLQFFCCWSRSLFRTIRWIHGVMVEYFANCFFWKINWIVFIGSLGIRINMEIQMDRNIKEIIVIFFFCFFTVIVRLLIDRKN